MSHPINDAWVKQCILQLVKEVIDIDLSPIQIQRFERLWGVDIMEYRGPAYQILDRSGKLLLAAKVYVPFGKHFSPYNKVLTSYQIFKGLKLKKSRCVDINTHGHFTSDFRSCDVIIMSPVKGKEVLEMIQDIGSSTEKERQSKINLLLEGVRAMGESLGELHAAHINIQGQVGEKYLQKADEVIRNFIHLLTKSPGLFPFDKKDVIAHLAYLKSQQNGRSLAAGVIHGDPNPSNMIYHQENQMITMLDIDDLADSVIGGFEPIGPIVQDYVHALLHLRKRMIFRRFIKDHRIQVEISFCQAYQKYLGKFFPSDEVLEYFSILFWIRKILFVSAFPSRLPLDMQKDPQLQLVAFNYRKLAITSLQEHFMRE
ncbi:MAG: phosphotransferase [Waddliaceae bacterium]